MDSDTLKVIRKSLLERKHRLEVQTVPALQEQEREAGEEISAEVIDMAQALEHRERTQSLVEQERREALAIEHALNKMTSGTFGMCEDCDEAIPSRRLLVLPQARLCARCQEVEERQQSRMMRGTG